jgi:hypothetical protein
MSRKFDTSRSGASDGDWCDEPFASTFDDLAVTAVTLNAGGGETGSAIDYAEQAPGTCNIQSRRCGAVFEAGAAPRVNISADGAF